MARLTRINWRQKVIRTERAKVETVLSGLRNIPSSFARFWRSGEIEEDEKPEKTYTLTFLKDIERNGYTLNKKIYTVNFNEIRVENSFEDLTFNALSGNPFTSKDDKWTLEDFDSDPIARGALDTHVGANATLEYYFEMFGRNSIDNQGMAILNGIAPIITNNGEAEDGHNAFYAGAIEFQGERYALTTYLDGVTRRVDSPFEDVGLVANIDVIGHEITHGVTNFTAGLIYQGESGAINESISDIFGTAIKARLQGKDEQGVPLWGWNMGEDWWPIRNMAQPELSFRPAPDTYQGEHWISDPLIDKGGVHTNSSVMNFWFVLCAEGSGNQGPGRLHPELRIGEYANYTNDNGYQYSVKAVGFRKIQGVVYRALAEYLEDNSTFLDARQATIQSARDLRSKDISDLYPGVPKLQRSDIESIRDAWDAVGVGGGLEPSDASLGL